MEILKQIKKKFKDKGAPYAIAWAQHNKHGKPKKEAELEEGLKDWAKKTAILILINFIKQLKANLLDITTQWAHQKDFQI